MQLLRLTCCCVLLGTATAVNFENCAPDNELGEWYEVSVLGCGKDDSVCVLRRNERIGISIDFRNKKREWRLLSVVSGLLGGIEMPFELRSPDACVGAGLSCPLTPGNHTYTYSMFVGKDKPKLKLKVKWQILNELKKPIVCVIIPARIR